MIILEYKNKSRQWAGGVQFQNFADLQNYLDKHDFSCYFKRGKFTYYQNYAAPSPLSAYSNFRVLNSAEGM